MFAKLKAKASSAKQSAMSKLTKKANTDDEPAEFVAKLTGITSIADTFKHLTKVGKQIWMQQPETENVSTSFAQDIKSVQSLKSKYNKSLVNLQSAKKSVGDLEKNEGAKNRDEKLEAARTKQEGCQTVYEEAKSDFASAYDELESKRDRVYEETVQQLQGILGAMQPIWAGGAAPRSSTAEVEEKEPEVEAVNVVNSDSDGE